MNLDYESIIELKNEQSKRTAWRAFAVMTVLCVVLAIAIMMMTPLKRTEVRLLVVDKNTGYPSEITALADFPAGDTRQMQASEALNKYFVQSYIIAHDSYNHYNVRDAYRTVQLWSTEDVFADYAKLFSGANDIQKSIGSEKVLEVVVHSMNPLPQPTEFNGEETGKMMQARIEKIIRRGDTVEKRATGTVTISFGYDTNLRMDEQSRNFNPLGFTVTAYQFVPDQRTEDFPVKSDFYTEKKPEMITPQDTVSPKAPESTLQGSVSPASAVSGQPESVSAQKADETPNQVIDNTSKEVSGNLNESPKVPEPARQESVPPAVADNSGNTVIASEQSERGNPPTTENDKNLSGNLKDSNQGESK